jgi:hypothetical protein
LPHEDIIAEILQKLTVALLWRRLKAQAAREGKTIVQKLDEF